MSNPVQEHQGQHFFATPSQSLDDHDAIGGGDIESPRDDGNLNFDQNSSSPSLENWFDETEDNDDPLIQLREESNAYGDSTSELVSAAATAGAAEAVEPTSTGPTTPRASRSCLRKSSYPASPKSPDSVHTARTVGTDVSQSPEKSSTVTIEHQVKTKGSGGGKSMAKMKKPIMVLAAAFGLLMTGGAAFFFTKWLEIPGLNAQIERLEEQVDELEFQVDRLESEVDRLAAEVDRLDEQVDRLSEENDRFAQLNEQLAANNAEYEALNEALRNTTAQYAELNDQLNASNVELERLNDELQEQNEQYSQLNEQLNTTVINLQEEVGILENVTINLTVTNVELRESVLLLTDQVETFQAENEFLNNTVFALDQEVDFLTNETNRLAQLNDNLGNIVAFLNETAAGIDESYNAISEFLSEQITAYRGFVMDTLQNVYIQRVTNWDCDFRSFFLTQPFVRDPSIPIGSTDYPNVIDYVEERILSELCLDTDDFEKYLDEEHVQDGQDSPANVTTNQLRRAVNLYTRNAVGYYFPSSNDPPGDGPDGTDWAAADYNCENLPSDKRFFVYS